MTWWIINNRFYQEKSLGDNYILKWIGIILLKTENVIKSQVWQNCKIAQVYIWVWFVITSTKEIIIITIIIIIRFKSQVSILQSVILLLCLGLQKLERHRKKMVQRITEARIKLKRDWIIYNTNTVLLWVWWWRWEETPSDKLDWEWGKSINFKWGWRKIETLWENGWNL